RRAGERNLEQLQHRDHRRLERRDAIDSLAHFEREIELPLSQLLDPLPILIHGDVADFVAFSDEGFLDGLDGAEDSHVGLRRVGGRAVKQNGDFHAAPAWRLDRSVWCERRGESWTLY